MAVRTLEQILAEIGSIYEPQVQNVRQKQAAIPGRIASEERGLEAKQTQSFEEIMGGARRRGMGFSGIPVAEQYRYNATEFQPALARLRQQGHSEALSLEDAIFGINERKSTLAHQLRQTDVDNDFRERQFAAAQEEARRAAARAAAASSGFGGFGGGSGGGGGNKPAPTKGNPHEEWAAASVKKVLGTNNAEAIVSDYNAARRYYMQTGNEGDKLKLIFYQQQRPDLFGGGTPALPKYSGPSGKTYGNNIKNITF